MDSKNSIARGGYTLAEVLVVVMILSIAAAMVIPNVISTSDMQAVGAARIIAADLQYAQSVAITTQVPVTVEFDPASESYSLRNASGLLIHPMNKTGYTIRFSSLNGYDRLDVTSASFGGTASVTFDEMGSANNSGTVVVQAGAHVYRIAVAPATGKVTVTRSS